MKEASAAIKQTRGAAAAIVRVTTSGKLLFVGVGNIEMHAVSRERIRPVCTPGIVGRNVRKIIVFEYAVHQVFVKIVCVPNNNSNSLYKKL